MLDPKTPLAAAAIFGAGILVGSGPPRLLAKAFKTCCNRVSARAAGYWIFYLGRE